MNLNRLGKKSSGILQFNNSAALGILGTTNAKSLLSREISMLATAVWIHISIKMVLHCPSSNTLRAKECHTISQLKKDGQPTYT